MKFSGKNAIFNGLLKFINQSQISKAGLVYYALAVLTQEVRRFAAERAIQFKCSEFSFREKNHPPYGAGQRY